MRTLYAIVIRPYGLEQKTPAGFATVRLPNPYNPGAEITLRRKVDAEGNPIRILPAPKARVHGRVFASLSAANEEAHLAAHPGVEVEVMNTATLDIMRSAQIADAIAVEGLTDWVTTAENERRGRIVSAWFSAREVGRNAANRRMWANAQRASRTQS